MGNSYSPPSSPIVNRKKQTVVVDEESPFELFVNENPKDDDKAEKSGLLQKNDDDRKYSFESNPWTEFQIEYDVTMRDGITLQGQIVFLRGLYDKMTTSKPTCVYVHQYKAHAKQLMEWIKHQEKNEQQIDQLPLLERFCIRHRRTPQQLLQMKRVYETLRSCNKSLPSF